MKNQETKEFLTDHLGRIDFKLKPIGKGGSDRSFFRIILPNRASLVLMRYGDEAVENAHWAGINKFMTSLDMNVPRMLARDDERHLILMEDLGDVDLWSLRFEPWAKRRGYYFQALAQIYRLHSYDLKSVPADLPLSESYGPKLYQWEHDYFLENLVGAVCGIALSSADAAKLSRELNGLSAHLQKLEPSLIHRDFQSQNIMIKNERPVMIDFQGMRLGCLFYDLGSLICDPYVSFEDKERNELLDFYYELMKPCLSRDEFAHDFWMASVQRLLQALGAYGFLGLKKGKKEFLAHIGNGLNNLLVAISHTKKLPALHDLAQRCRNSLPPALGKT